MSSRAIQKLHTRNALLAAARGLMADGRGFGSLSLREVSRCAGLAPAGFYRHFSDMDAFGLALVAEVGETFRATLRQVRRHERERRGLIEASVAIFLAAVQDHRAQFLFLAREQYGGSPQVRQAIADLRAGITTDLVHDLALLGSLPHLGAIQLAVVADLVVKTVFATLPELIDPVSPAAALAPALKMEQQLKLILVGGKHWRAYPEAHAPEGGMEKLATSAAHQMRAS